MSTSTPLRALVFGASGITGWAIVKEALQYPTPTAFNKVIGLTNRPLTKPQALLPEDDRLEL
jgi:nucleoside-diphosphate-sugar epimerase